VTVRGRPILGFFGGLLFGVAVALALLVFGVLALDSIVLVVIPIVGLVVGFTAPFGRHRPPPSPAVTPPPAPPPPGAPLSPI
jgi:multisubunit Na+/H+ antiporter MnhB subunit